jgi:hypothetical protein
MTSDFNCGTCGHACGGGPHGTTCISGTCVCASGTQCGAACVDTTTDLNNCGSCGKKCATLQTCSASACSCPNLPGTTAPEPVCGGACSDTNDDPLNCGKCSNSASIGQYCVHGAFQCRPGSAVATSGPFPGTCATDLYADAQNCGTVGTICAKGKVCIDGACAAFPSAGCASLSGHHAKCTVDGVATCVDTDHDALNCGGCGALLAPNQVCVSGVATLYVVDHGPAGTFSPSVACDKAFGAGGYIVCPPIGGAGSGNPICVQGSSCP